MSGYTSGNNAPTLMAQAPNRRGNQSKHTPGPGGVTAVTRPQGSLSQPAGKQGAAKAGGSPGTGRGQKVMVSRPECYDKTPNNSAYMDKSVKNYLG